MLSSGKNLITLPQQILSSRGLNRCANGAELQVCAVKLINPTPAHPTPFLSLLLALSVKKKKKGKGKNYCSAIDSEFF